MQISLWFNDRGAPELFRIRLAGTDGVVFHEAVRGQYSFAPGGATFAWTSGVHAFSLLCLRGALSGERQSPAVTIDYALSKQPRWIVDLCGSGRCGNALLPQLVTIQNSNGKRPGPVEVRLRPAVTVKAYLGTGPALSASGCAKVAEVLQSTWRPHGSRRRRATASENPVTSVSMSRTLGGSSAEEEHTAAEFQQTMHRLISAEVSHALRCVPIHRQPAYTAHVKTLVENPSFRRIAGKTPFSLLEDSLDLPASLRCGVGTSRTLKPLFERPRPLQVGIGLCNVGPLALFSELERVMQLPFNVDSNFAHALELATRITKQDPLIDHELVAIASAPAASLLARHDRHEYVPLMLLPSTSQHLIERAGEHPRPRSKRRQVSLLHEEPSTALFYFEELDRREYLRQRDCSLVHEEPWESFARLAGGGDDVASVLFFPFDRINILYNGCRSLDDPRYASGTAQVMLFAHRSITSDRPLLTAIAFAVRTAWIALLESDGRREQAVASFVSDAGYRTALRRVAGLSASFGIHNL